MNKKVIWKSEYPEMEIYEDGKMELTNVDGEYDYRDLHNLLQKLSYDYVQHIIKVKLSENG